MASSLSGISSQDTIKEPERKNRSSTSHEVDNSLEAMIPDGTWTQVLCHLFITFWETAVVISNDLV